MRPPSFRRLHGFTLVEIMIAMSICVLVAGMAMDFIAEGTRASLRASASMSNNLTQWAISSRLQLDSKLANGAAIYASFNDSDLAVGSRRLAGQRGNVLILSSSIAKQADNAARYTKISGYEYDSVAHTLSRFEYNVAENEQTNGLETIVKAHKDDFTKTLVAATIDSLDTSGPFVSRDSSNANAATATFRLNQSNAYLKTNARAVIEISFLIRG